MGSSRGQTIERPDILVEAQPLAPDKTRVFEQENGVGEALTNAPDASIDGCSTPIQRVIDG